MPTEKLKFQLELYATMWDKPPHVEVMINDKSHFAGGIQGSKEKPDIIEFEHEFEVTSTVIAALLYRTKFK